MNKINKANKINKWINIKIIIQWFYWWSTYAFWRSCQELSNNMDWNYLFRSNSFGGRLRLDRTLITHGSMCRFVWGWIHFMCLRDLVIIGIFCTVKLQFISVICCCRKLKINIDFQCLHLVRLFEWGHVRAWIFQ